MAIPSGMLGSSATDAARPMGLPLDPEAGSLGKDVLCPICRLFFGLQGEVRLGCELHPFISDAAKRSVVLRASLSNAPILGDNMCFGLGEAYMCFGLGEAYF